MKLAPSRILLLWLLAMLAAAAVIARTSFVADMSFFLPANPSPTQRTLVEQMTEGSVSRLLMLAIDGGSEVQRARASVELQRSMMDSGLFLSVRNGQISELEAERDFLLRWRYHLSPAVSPERFQAPGLRQAIDRSISLASSPVGAMFKPYLLQDPTGEMVEILMHMDSGSQLHVRNGVWSSANGERALVMAQTRATGSDLDGQAHVIKTVENAFNDFRRQTSGADALQLTVSGPGYFAVQSREVIRDEIIKTSLLGLLGITLVLSWVYRSPRTLALGLLPVLTAAVVGIVVVSLVHGQVHGVTAGFGAALIGEAVDYAIYFNIQSGRLGLQAWRRHFWPTIRLGVLTSVTGFGALLMAGFPGLTQLGLYALSGIVTAALMTRFVLPALAGTRGVSVPPAGVIANGTRGWLAYAHHLRLPLLALAVLAALYLTTQHGQLWTTNLSTLSTISADDGQIDAKLRSDLGAPDARYLVLVRGRDHEAVLERTEQAGAGLRQLVRQGVIAGFDSPVTVLPSRKLQAERLAALPDADTLTAALASALADSPLSAGRLDVFVDDVAAARQARLLTRADLDGTAFALMVDALLNRTEGGWTAVLPLQLTDRQIDDLEDIPVPTIEQAVAGSGAVVIDLKSESEQLYASYLTQAVWLSLGGVLAIVALLALTLRSPARLARIVLALATTVALVMAGLHLSGIQLNLLHLVGFLLVVAVGSNYALFFDQLQSPDQLSAELWLSMSTAVLTTSVGFGALALANVPVLRAFGITVAPGVLLAMLVSAAMIHGRQEKMA